MGRFEIESPIGPKAFVPDIVYKNEQNIGLVSNGRCQKRGQSYEKQRKDR
jgi:hypothetical protein